MTGKKHWGQYAFLGLVLLLVGVSLYILSGYATAIIFGGILAYLIHPLYLALDKSIKKPNLSAFIVSVLLVLLLTVPLILVTQQLATDLNQVYDNTVQLVGSPDLFATDCAESTTPICDFLATIEPYIDQNQFRQYLSQGVSVFLNFLAENLRNILLSIPSFGLNILIMLLVLFYAVRDGPLWIKSFKESLPFAKRHTKKIFEYTNDTLYALLYGQLITAMAQGLLGGIGFWIFGVSNPIFWGVIMAFLSIFPIIGAWLVWAPAVVSLLIVGDIPNAIGLALFCGIFVSMSDNILRPYVVAEKADIHPLVVMLGVFGGLAVFGITGFILGPLVIALTLVLAKVYNNDLH